MSNEHYFQGLCQFHESAKEGEKLTATKEGTVKGKFIVEGSRLTVSLENVLFVNKL